MCSADITRNSISDWCKLSEFCFLRLLKTCSSEHPFHLGSHIGEAIFPLPPLHKIPHPKPSESVTFTPTWLKCIHVRVGLGILRWRYSWVLWGDSKWDRHHPEIKTRGYFSKEKPYGLRGRKWNTKSLHRQEIGSSRESLGKSCLANPAHLAQGS